MKLALVTLSLTASAVAHAQPRQPDTRIDAEVRRQVIDASLAALRERYVFPEVAATIDAAIRARLAGHACDGVTSAIELARLRHQRARVTAARAVRRDRPGAPRGRGLATVASLAVGRGGPGCPSAPHDSFSYT